MGTSRRSNAVGRRVRLLKPVFARSARGSDRLEGLLILAVGLLAVVSVAIVCVHVVADHDRLAASVAADARARHQVVATLRPDLPVPAGAEPAGGELTPVTATWPAPHGQVRRGVVEVGAGPALPQHVQVWVDQAGAQVAPPLTGAEAFTTAILGGVVWESVALLVLGGVYLLFRRGLDRHRARLWDRECERGGWQPKTT
ncbi:Rv1733c family protein [Amycolatopsis stemonae]